MFEYTCPKCHTIASEPTLPSGKIAACQNCGQKLRVALAPDDDEVPSSGRGSLWLVGGSALVGLAIGAVFVVLAFSGPKAAQRTDRDRVAVVTEPRSRELLPDERPPVENVIHEPPRDKDKDGARDKDKDRDGARDKDSGKDKDKPKDQEPPAEKDKPKDDSKKDKKDPDEDFELPKITVAKQSAEEIYKKSLKSVVWINVWEKVTLRDGTVKIVRHHTGTGSLIDRENRLVITNQHVVNESAVRVEVLFPSYDSTTKKLIAGRSHYEQQIQDGKTIPAKLVQPSNVTKDLAVIQLDRLPDDVDQIGRAAESPGSGKDIICIGGSPAGNDAGMWILSPGKVRQVYNMAWGYGDGFRREATIISSNLGTNSGDSGGPIIDDRGILVGVNAMGARVIDKDKEEISGWNQNVKHIDITEVNKFLRFIYEDKLQKQYPEPKEVAPNESVAPVDLEKLIKALHNQKSGVTKRKSVIQLLASLGSSARLAIPDLLRILRDPKESKEIRDQVATALVDLGTPGKEYLDALIEAMGDLHAPDTRARLYSADAMGRLADQARPGIQALVKALKEDPGADVRQAAAVALGKVGFKVRDEISPPLVTALNDKEEDVRLAAANALISLGTPSLSRVVLAVMLTDKASSREGRMYAAWGLGRLGPLGITALTEAVRSDPLPDVVLWSVRELGRLKVSTPEVSKALALAVDRPEETICLTAADAIFSIGVDAVMLPAMLKALARKEKSKAFSQLVLVKLPLMGSFVKYPFEFKLTRDSVDELRAALKSDDPLARAVAAYLLGTLGSDAAPAVADFRALLPTERNPIIKREILCALPEIGPAAAAALPELKALFKETGDDMQVVKRCAALAVARLATDKKDRALAYDILAQAMFLKNVMDPNSVEKGIHDRARKVLAEGKAAAAEALATTYTARLFDLRSPDVGSVDMVQARIAVLQVIAAIGPDAVSPKVKNFLDWASSSTRNNLELAEVRAAAKEAHSAVLQK
jgi:HEAT repeat protein